MDWYFLLCIVVFFTIGIVMVMFAFQGPRCVDFDESHYEELSREEQLSQQNLNLSMPLPPDDDEIDNSPAVSLTSPYPQKPPPIGFSRILAERGQVTNPYSQQEDVGRMPFPPGFSSFSHVDPPSNFSAKFYEPSHPRVSEMLPHVRATQSPSVSTQTCSASSTRHEPPPPYTETMGQTQPSVHSRRNRFKKRLSQ